MSIYASPMIFPPIIHRHALALDAAALVAACDHELAAAERLQADASRKLTVANVRLAEAHRNRDRALDQLRTHPTT